MSVRDEYLAHFRDTARAIFAKRPELRSIVLGASQYWNDEADDAVHEWIVASERDVPLWPHVCDGGWHDEDNPIERVSGEVCESCGGLLDEPGYLTWWHDNSTAVEAFEPYCHESGSQGRPDWYNALPAAIARKRGDDIEVELLGPVQRPHSILQAGGEAGLEDPMWRDPRALELYEQVCAAPADDGPRRVLADYLLEREIPRGDLIAHALAASPTYAEMLAANRETWLAPLSAIVPIDTAKFDRGFSPTSSCSRWIARIEVIRRSRRSSACTFTPAARRSSITRCARCARSARSTARGSRISSPRAGRGRSTRSISTSPTPG